MSKNRDNIKVVLVEPLYGGNIGSIARIMKNLGYRDLCLVKGCSIGDEARAMASHAADILDTRQTFDSIQDATKGCNLIVGTTAKLSYKDDKHVRAPVLTPEQLREQVNGPQRVALLFGREDTGLLNTELEICDLIVSIPTDQEYPTMNISHAVAILLYVLSTEEGKTPGMKTALKDEKEQLIEHYSKVMDLVEYPPHKKKGTLIMLRRILGRAKPTSNEIRTLRGVLRKTEWKVRQK